MVCPHVIDNEFRDNIVKESTWLRLIDYDIIDDQ